MLLTAVINAKERRCVVGLDALNDFVNCKNEDGQKVIMKMEGKLAELLVLTAPQIYRPYIVVEKGQKVLYVLVLTVIYGLLKSALLFYKKMRKILTENGFNINPYDVCVANKMVEDKQITVTWHVDDLKVSHKSEKVVNQFINLMRSKFKTDGVSKVKINREKIITYLGMKLDYSVDGELTVDMKEYVQEMVTDFSTMANLKKSKTPAASYLFDISKDAEALSEQDATVFHNLVARGLFVSKRACPDIQLPVVFLCTRIESPCKDNCEKLKRLVGYLHGTVDLTMTLKSESCHV